MERMKLGYDPSSLGSSCHCGVLGCPCYLDADILVEFRDHLATSLHITTDDLMEPGFTEHGGIGKAVQLFGPELDELLDELERELVA